MDKIWQMGLPLLLLVIVSGLTYFLTHRRSKELKKHGLSIYGNLEFADRVKFALFCTLIGLFQWIFWQHVINVSPTDISLATRIILVACVTGALIGWIPSKHKILWPLHWIVASATLILTFLGYLLTSLFLFSVQSPHAKYLLLSVVIFAVLNTAIFKKYHFSAKTEILYLSVLVGWDIIFWSISKTWI